MLADVYMRKWAKSVVKQPNSEEELYCCFRNDIFISTYRSKNEMNAFLTELGKKDKQIVLTFGIGEYVNYLDIKV